MKKGYTYIMSNQSNSTIYVGVTSDLVKRIYEHKNNLVKGFTAKYNLKKLVYYEIFDSIEQAICREKFLKGKKRCFKNSLINDFNPNWDDLYESIL